VCVCLYVWWGCVCVMSVFVYVSLCVMRVCVCVSCGCVCVCLCVWWGCVCVSRSHRINFDWVFGFHTKSSNQFHHITIAILTKKIINRAKHTKHRYQSQAKKGSKQTSVSARSHLGSPAKRMMTWQQDIGSRRLSYLLFCNYVWIEIFSVMPYMQNQ